MGDGLGLAQCSFFTAPLDCVIDKKRKNQRFSTNHSFRLNDLATNGEKSTTTLERLDRAQKLVDVLTSWPERCYPYEESKKKKY